MQRLMGYMRRAVMDFRMIENGDRIAVGVSGGKDSLALLLGLYELRRFIGIDYELVAITLDPYFGGSPTDYSAVARLCEERGIPYILKPTNIGAVVFDQRNEKNPCSLCARMRRGALHNAALEQGCNKVALGHHRDDAVETFLMNLFDEGRIGCFNAVTYLSRKDITLIRPLIYIPENIIRNTIVRLNIPIVKSRCPVDGHTSRERTKQFIRQKDKENKGFAVRLFGAVLRGGLLDREGTHESN